MRFFIMLIIASLVVLISPQKTKAAAANDPKVEEVCVSLKSSRRSPASPRRLVIEFLSAQGITDNQLVKVDRQVSEADRASAILDPRTFCATNGCDQKLIAKLDQVYVTMFEFFTRKRNDLKENESGFIVTPQLEGVPGERALRAFLGDEGKPFVVTCVSGREKPAKPERDTLAEKTQGFFSSLRVRKTISELEIIGPGLKKAGYAGFELSSDRIEQKTTISSDLVIGVPLNLFPRAYDAKYFGFLTHKSSRGNGVAPNADVGNVGVGVMGSTVFRNELGYHQVQLFTHYVSSYQTGTDLLIGNITLSPTLPFDGIAGPAVINDYLSLAWKPQLIFVYGNALNAERSLTFRPGEDFVRAGAKVGVWLYGEAGVLQNFVLNTSYEHLDVYRGPLDVVARYESSLEYQFGEAKSWSLKLTYANGRDLNTLEREKQITLGLGYRQ